MICKNCASEISNTATFCPYCGEKVENAYSEPAASQPAPAEYSNGFNSAPQYNAPNPQPQPQPQAYQQPNYQSAPQNMPQQNFYVSQQPQVPNEYKPLSPWAYFGYNLLFAIPIVGFICLIIFSVSSSNINRRNFARSFWCWLVIGIIIGIIFAVTGGLAMGGVAYGF